MNLKVVYTAMIALLAARCSASQEWVLYWYLLHLILFYDTRETCNIGKGIHKYVQDIPCYWTIKWRWNIKEQIRSSLKMEVLVCLETLLKFYQTTRCHISEDSNLHFYFCENLNFDGLCVHRTGGTALEFCSPALIIIGYHRNKETRHTGLT